ncbi:MAG TPA: double-strand break repair helicase AddA [Rhizomicrobium sp.]|nr:double-strand break repair helicase AddA [Rhizomicrobium sp.]
MSNALAASDPRRSAWVSANAGAGKTYTLANRVTRLLLDRAPPERILCLTYTKAAAAEMQGRLFDQLGEWSMLDDDKLSQRIENIGAEKPDAEGLREARRLFAKALETPGGLKIQTIHSFCQYLLARVPLEADVPPGFRVLDDQTARELMGEARAHVLDRAGRGETALADAAAHLVTQTSEARLHATLDAALGGDRRKLERFLATLPDEDGAVASAIRRAHGADPGQTTDSIATAFCAAVPDAECDRIVAWLLGGKADDIKRGEIICRARVENSFTLYRNAFLTDKGERRKKLATKALSEARPELAEGLEDMASQFIDAEQRWRAAHAASLAEAAVTLAAAARGEYAALKRARSVLDYDDLIAQTLTLLDRREAAAWVLYKLDGGIDHVLIDEAQDTSPEQWAIVRRLTEEFFAGQGSRGAQLRTVFAVGDEKQSIFSFQGADPLEFEANRRHFAKEATEGTHAFVDVRLSTSRRSAPEILSFVDRVFEDPTAREGVTSDGSIIAHDAHRKDAKGRVEFWPALLPARTPEPDPWRPVDVESESSPVARLADRIASQIKSWTDGKTRLPGHDKPIRPGDIMILMPRREPFASEIIRRLKERGVPVAGADRIRLNDQIAVMDLAALGRFVLLPEDDLNLAALLRSPLIDVSEEELFALAYGRSGSLWRALERNDTAPFVFARAFLVECRRRADFAPPYEFYAQALAGDKMRKRLLARLGPEADDAIAEFLSLALSYEALNAPSLEGFLNWLARGDAEIKRDMERGRDEVRVMTVHGAKGLEADIVILPDTTALPLGPGRHGDLLYTEHGPVFPVAGELAPEAVRKAKDAARQEMLKEHRRLLYVALTRARDRLYVCGFENKNGVREGSWYELAQRAAQSLGIALVRGGETVRVVGDADTETVAERTPARIATHTLPAWALNRPAPEHERPRLIRPSQAAGLEEPAGNSPVRNNARFQRGLLVHAMLAHLPEIEPARRREMALAYLAARGAEDAATLVDETLAVLNDPAFAAVFAPGSRAEVAIVADLPEIGEGARINGRIDRLAVTDDEVLAIDFKTNRPPPARPEDVSTVYLAQMALYRAALSKIFPGRRIATALVWTEGPRLMRLPEPLLEAEIGRIRARLETP